MNTQAADRVTSNNRAFFQGLLDGDVVLLDRLLADDFLIVELGTGNVHARADFLAAVESRLVVFSAIDEDVSATILRQYADTAIMVGRTRMTLAGPDGSAVEAASRYSHVFVDNGEEWRLVFAQGTPITE